MFNDNAFPISGGHFLLPEKIYDGITAVNLRRIKNNFEMMTALLPSKKLNFFVKHPTIRPLPVHT